MPARCWGALADDSMEGRGTATPGGDRAARFIAERCGLRLVPAGDSGYFQRVPLAVTPDPDGRRRLALVTPARRPRHGGAAQRRGDRAGQRSRPAMDRRC